MYPIFNKDEIKIIMATPGQIYLNSKGREHAAKQIQIGFRNHLQKLDKKRKLLELKSSAIIKVYWKKYRMRSRFLKAHNNFMQNAMQMFDDRQLDFRTGGIPLLVQNRVIIRFCREKEPLKKQIDIEQYYHIN
jgi:hypothetical protein